MNSLPDKNNEPLTSAVAPIAEKTIIEKSVSPLEGKENIPIELNNSKEIGAKQTNIDDDVIEVPYKPPTPEIIDLEADEPSETFDVKKRKLDILKEGGLEVTAVSSNVLNVKDTRPSVIQNSVPNRFKHDLGNLSITLSANQDTKKMPPPVSKKAYTISAVPNVTQRKTITKEVTNGFSPPKVVQSRSIFNYSEKIVYGNPKDIFTPPQTVAVPKLQPNNTKSIPDVLDLTVKSPQKPIVEIMRIPNVSNLSSRLQNAPAPQKSIPKTNPNLSNLPNIDRIGSNLEITLVSANKVSNKDQPKPQPQNIPSYPSKRTSNGTIKPPYKPETNILRKNSNPNLNDLKNSPFSLQNPMFPYMNQLATQKSLPLHPAQAYLPLLDPIYYSALCSQNLGFPTSPLTATPPMFPQMPSVDQLQLFKELMARGRLPFMPNLMQDGNMSISHDNSNVKK